MPHNTEEITHAYVSKYSNNRENELILLLTTDGKKWYYLALKRLSTIPRRMTSKNDGDFYCLNCLHLYRTEKPNDNNKILKCNHGEKSMKGPYIIYADLESLLEKMSTCHNSSEKSSKNKIRKRTPFGYSLFTQCSFDATKNKMVCCRSKDCMKMFCRDLKERTAEIIKHEKKNDTTNL